MPIRSRRDARLLSPLAVWALSVGSAIGWGSLVVTSGSYLGQAGPLGSVPGLLVGKALQDANYGRLASAVEADDRKAAFEAIHAIKGVVGNLALTPLYDAASEMTELLRAGKDADYPALPVKHAFDRGCDLLAVIERHAALAELYAIP